MIYPESCSRIDDFLLSPRFWIAILNYRFLNTEALSKYQQKYQYYVDFYKHMAILDDGEDENIALMMEEEEEEKNWLIWLYKK